MFEAKNYLYIISAKRREFLRETLEAEKITLMEAEILLFLHANKNSNTLTEIINARDYTKSHVSTALSKLEEIKYISKNKTNQNKKTIQLELTIIGQEVVKRLNQTLTRFHNLALKEIDLQDVEAINKVMSQICNNLKEVKK